jgi:putative hydrolase of the HAD superfamily
VLAADPIIRRVLEQLPPEHEPVLRDPERLDGGCGTAPNNHDTRNPGCWRRRRVRHSEQYTPANHPLRYNEGIPQQVVTFDAGQTLVDLDLDFLARRLREERRIEVDPALLAAATPAAWAHYDQLVDRGADHVTGWKGLLGRILDGVADASVVDWLYEQNRPHNLWRFPIAGMTELARELRSRGVRVAVLSNSEGMLAELLTEIGMASAFDVIIDSGKVGLEKPGRAIFDHTLAALDAIGADAIHIGDSYNADIVGARNAGWRAIWFGRRIRPVDDPGIAIARDASEVRAALMRWL